ncbi:MAG: response regulator [Candidatus Lokiarchaeota archaeon]|nr:response regulator [Candidatus Lokiarchaeota archaeon]MBD3343294.1 response regulator [Candidatus Lokiarchaeota archaeon]
MQPLILIVDDNPELLTSLKRILEINNYKVKTATNGKAALKILSDLSELPDLIISDIVMSELGGYDFFQKIASNAQYYNIPFIFLTGLSSPEEIRLGKRLGVDDYITKPFKEEDLLATIKGKLFKRKITSTLEKNLGEGNKNKFALPNVIKINRSKNIKLFFVEWDDELGPIIDHNYYPKEKDKNFDIDKLGPKLFNGMVMLYGQDKIDSAGSILIHMDRIRRYAYLFF